MITFESLKSVDYLDNTPLGEGAFSFVYKVRHRHDGKTYAMKKIDILNLSKADCENLKLEIKLHQDLLQENIIKFYGCIQRKNLVYMLLEHASNGSLFFYIDIEKGLPELLALRFFYETAKGIQYLHDNCVVHRDIKPENILLDKDFRIKICDFGWSCKMEGDDVRSSICGTYEYMSPEIVNEESHDYGVDIWCLGILLFEMLHGNPPFHAENLNEIKKEFQKKSIAIDPKFDKDTIDLINQLLQYDSEDRITIAAALNHRAIQKNLKQIQRKITQEEYNLLTRYYYMNSGGNQLVTHNSTYARQLKRQSMLTKISQASYRSNDSDFFNTNDSITRKSDFFNSHNEDKVLARGGSGSGMEMMEPRKQFNGFNTGNDFAPKVLQDEKQNETDVTNSVFKKKPGIESEVLEVEAPPNMDTKVSERSLDFFKKNPKSENFVKNEIDQTVDVVAESFPGTETGGKGVKEDANPKYQNLNKEIIKEIEKVQNGGISKGKAGAEAHTKSGSGKRKVDDRAGKKTSSVKKKALGKYILTNPKPGKARQVDPLRTANENFAKRVPANQTKKPKDLMPNGHTTLKQFQQQYNQEKFKKKFQADNNGRPTQVNNTKVNNVSEKRNTQQTPPVNSGLSRGQSKPRKNGEQIKSKANTGNGTVRTITQISRNRKDLDTDFKSHCNQLTSHVQSNNSTFIRDNQSRYISKSPSTGAFYTAKPTQNGQKVLTTRGINNIKSNVKTNPKTNTKDNVKNDNSTTHRGKASKVGEITSKPAPSIPNRHQPSRTPERRKLTTNITSISKPPTSIFTNLHNRSQQQQSHPSGPGQPIVAFQSVNTKQAVKPVPIPAKDYKSNNNNDARKNLKRQYTEVQKVTMTQNYPNRMVSSSQDRTFGSRSDRANFSRGLHSADRYGRGGNKLNTTTMVRTFEETPRVEHRYSLGVRSQTFEQRISEPRRHDQDKKNSDTDQNKTFKSENKKKLSQIFEEPSPIKYNGNSRRTPGSLFEHLKQNKKPSQTPETFIKLIDIDSKYQARDTQADKGLRSKSGDVSIARRGKGIEGKFNKRVVYINGVKTEKFIYSKGRKDAQGRLEGSENAPENKGLQTVQDQRNATPNKENANKHTVETSNGKHPLATEDTEKPIVNVNATLSPNTEDTTPESETPPTPTTITPEKKKYKVITVPQTKARVIQEGGLKFSNVKPITIIQQGNFALSSSRSKNQSTNFSSNNLDKTGSSRKIPNLALPEAKKSIEVARSERNRSRGDQSVPKKRVISYQEYKRRIQKTLEDNLKSSQGKTPATTTTPQTKLNLKNIIEENGKPSRTLYEQYNNMSRDRSVDARGKKVYMPGQLINSKTPKGPTITRLTRTMSKPYLEPARGRSVNATPVQANSNVSFNNTHSNFNEEPKITKYFPQDGNAQKEGDNIETLVQKLTQLNQQEQESNVKSKTTGSISLKTLIRQVNQEVNPTKGSTNAFGYLQNQTQTQTQIKSQTQFKTHTQTFIQPSSQPLTSSPPLRYQTKREVKSQTFRHKKNNTMYNINQQETLGPRSENNKIKSESSHDNQVPGYHQGFSTNTLHHQQTPIQTQTQNYQEKGYSRSSQREYKPKSGPGSNMNIKSPLQKISTKTTENQSNTMMHSTKHQVKIYANNPLTTQVFNSKSNKSTSQRQIEPEMTDRLSYRGRGWTTVASPVRNLKQSSSVKKLDPSLRISPIDLKLAPNTNPNMNPGKLSSTYNKTTNESSFGSTPNYSFKVNKSNLKHLQSGNVPTMVRRYTVTPPGKANAYRYENPQKSPVQRSVSRNVTNTVPGKKKQIFTDFNELKKNLKTNFYNQN